MRKNRQIETINSQNSSRIQSSQLENILLHTRLQAHGKRSPYVHHNSEYMEQSANMVPYSQKNKDLIRVTNMGHGAKKSANSSRDNSSSIEKIKIELA